MGELSDERRAEIDMLADIEWTDVETAMLGEALVDALAEVDRLRAALMSDHPDWEGFRNDLTVLGLGADLDAIEQAAATHLVPHREDPAMTTTAQLRDRLAAINAETDPRRGDRLYAFAEELIGRLEQQPAPGYDDRPDWGRPTELGAADRDPNTRG